MKIKENPKQCDRSLFALCDGQLSARIRLATAVASVTISSAIKFISYNSTALLIVANQCVMMQGNDTNADLLKSAISIFACHC